MRKAIFKIKFTICCILYISISLGVVAQQPETNFNLTSFTPRSPNVAAMERFGTYPINHYTGTVPLSVDLYSLPLSKEFTLNVQLQYHSGGIKVSDVNSWMYIIIEKGSNFYMKSIPLRKDFKGTKNA